MALEKEIFLLPFGYLSDSLPLFGSRRLDSIT